MQHRPIAAAFCAGLLLWCGPSGAQERFKPDVIRQYGGTYTSNCSVTGAARLRVLHNTLVLEQGDKRVVGHAVKVVNSYFGKLPPPHFQIALAGEVPSGATLNFLVFEDPSGIHIRVQADAALQVALGKSLLGPKYRRCEETRRPAKQPNTVQNEPMSDAEKMLLDPRFKSTYQQALGPLVRERWLAQFEGPRPPVRRVRAAGMDYVLAAVCKAHDCTGYNAALLYAEDRNVVFGQVYEHGKITLLGAPPPDVVDALGLLWANQWLRK